MWLIVLLGVLGGLAALALLYGFLVEPRWLRVRRRVLHLDGWDPALDGFTILHLSDLHVRPEATPVDGFLRRSGGIPADVVVITGDFLGKPPRAQRAAEAITPAIAGRPAFAVLGNHEHAVYGFTVNPNRSFNTRRLLNHVAITRTLESAGACFLTNRSARVPYNGGWVTLAGIDDMYKGAPDLDAALGPSWDPASTVLLSHAPDVLAEAARRGIALVLSGHTHGGQVRFPLLGAPFTGTRVPLERPSGVIRLARTTMHISPGLGLSFPPARFFSRPEITILELRSRLDG